MQTNYETDRDAVWNGFFWSSQVPNLKLYLRMKPCLLKTAKEYTPSKRGHRQTLAGIILSGWGTKNEETKERLISNNEMNDVLLHSDEDFRLHTLWQLGKWLNETQENNENENWSDMVPELLQNVWPRQKSVKTPGISTRLCDLTFSNIDHFKKLSGIVLPLLTTCDQNHLRLPNLRRFKDTIIDIYPYQTLALLYVVLPDNIASWPYDIEDIFQKISEADIDLNSDERLLELKWKWNAR